MIDLQTINHRAQKDAFRAHRRHVIPAVPTSSQVHDLRHGTFGSFQVPSLGDYTPPGWHLVDTVLVDVTGLDKGNGLALTQGAFARRIAQDWEPNVRRGYAVKRQGEFQFLIGIYQFEN